MKGIYTINKYEAIRDENGEWACGEFIETFGEHENTITGQFSQQIFANEYGQTRKVDNVVACVSELAFTGARVMEGNDATYSIRGTVNNNAFHTAAVGPTDPFWTIDSLINPPGVSTRQIRTVYLSSLYGGSSDDALSIVSLSTPCPQTTTEILQITYKLTLDRTTLNAEGTRSTYANETHFSDLIDSASGSFAPVSSYVLSYDSARWGNGIKRNVSGTLSNTQSITEFLSSGLTKIEGELGETNAKHRIHETTTTGQFGNSNDSTQNSFWCGFPVKGLGVGAHSSSTAGVGMYGMASVGKGSDSSVQNTFGRSADTGSARPPFLDTGIIATSAAGINIVDKGDWVDQITDSYTMPWLYRITMETGGLVGASTYKIRRRRLCRTYNNEDRWYPSGIQMPMMNLSLNGAQGQHQDGTTATEVRHGQYIWDTTGTTSSTRYQVMNSTLNGWAGYVVGRYVYPEFLTWDYTGITINSVEQLWTNVDTNTTPALSVTEVLQVATDGLDIYVADAATGLHKIEREFGDYDPSNYTITLLSPPGITDTTSCRGVFAKGGSINGHPGKVVAIRVINGGSEYAAGDTVTFVGANGTGATAEVGAVDGNGAITSITVTAQGSGYIEDHLQTYISSTTGGVGGRLEPIIGSGGDIWALFDDATDGDMYLAHMTHVGTNDWTNLNFDTTGDTITRTGGTDFLVDGFRVGQRLIVRTAEDAGNTGTFTITAVTSTVITVSENLTTNATDTQAQLFAENWEVMKETITTTESLTFADANPDTIVGSGTSFITQGFVEGMTIVISGSVSNNNTYTIADVTATTITLDSQDTLVAEGPVSCTMAALTDFTITNYTSGTPGRTGFIGLVMDPEHADDRFLMLTPTTKVVNDGSTDISSSTGGWDWWSFANSTGTTTAGTTDRIRVAASLDNATSSAELLGPLAVGPLSTGPDHWACNGKSELDTGYATWGSATAVTSRTLGINRVYSALRTSASFDISVACLGTANNRQFRTCNDITEMSSGSTSDSILLYDFGVFNDDDLRPANTSRRGEQIAYLGKGMFLGFQDDSTPSSAEPSGAFVFTCNGDGTQATEDAMAYGFWEEYGWDGNDWVLDNASAKTTHAQVSFSGSSLNINATTGAIIGSGFASTDWAGDGFLVGDIITLTDPDNPENDGQYVIESLSGTTLTVTPNKLPTTTDTATAGTVLGDHALIDGLAISFDDNGAADAFVVDEYYDTHLYDGILKDNATRVVFDTFHTWAGDDQGTDFATVAGGTTTTIPNSDTGAVTDQPLMALYYAGGTSAADNNGFVGPGEAGMILAETQGTPFAHKLDQSSDFVVRFKVAGAYVNATNVHDVHFGVVPWSTITDGTFNIAITELDENIKVEYDKDFPTHDQYTIRVRNTGNGADQLVYSADRIVTIAAQDETDFDGTASNGTFIGGDGAGGTTHAVADVITLDDGTQVTVATGGVDGNGDVTLFDITTKGTSSRGRTEASVAGTFTSLNFQNTGSTITRTGGSGFIVDGFLVGMKLIVDGSTNNDGHYTITAVADTVITVAEALTTNASENPTTFSSGLVQTATTGSGTQFALILGTANEAISDVANDEFSMHRIGTGAGNTSWRLNGVQFYAYAGALHTATDMGLCYHPDNSGYTQIYDGTIDYELNGRFLRVGNGTTTGTADPNFRCLPSLVGGTELLRLYYDSGSGPVELTYVTDGYTAPAANEVTIMPYAGLLWFNTANATDTITGNWTITKIDNMT
jgi:hypothetical protein